MTCAVLVSDVRIFFIASFVQVLYVGDWLTAHSYPHGVRYFVLPQIARLFSSSAGSRKRSVVNWLDIWLITGLTSAKSGDCSTL